MRAEEALLREVASVQVSGVAAGSESEASSHRQLTSV